MKIKLNGKDNPLAHAQSLSELIKTNCKNNRHIIAEVNGEIVKSPMWGRTSIKDGDTVELLNFVGGGEKQ